jgi:hypothetical protein
MIKMAEKMILYMQKVAPVVKFVENVPKGHFVSGLISGKILTCQNRKSLVLPEDRFYHVTYLYDKISVNDVLTFIRVYQHLIDEQRLHNLTFKTTGFEKFKSREHPDATIWSVSHNTKANWPLIYFRWQGWEWAPHITDYDNVIHQNDMFNAIFQLTFSYHKHEFIPRSETMEFQRFKTVINTLHKYV